MAKPTIAIYYYYSVQKLIISLPSNNQKKVKEISVVTVPYFRLWLVSAGFVAKMRFRIRPFRTAHP